VSSRVYLRKKVWDKWLIGDEEFVRVAAVTLFTNGARRRDAH
jgi:hypothetical protein